MCVCVSPFVASQNPMEPFGVCFVLSASNDSCPDGSMNLLGNGSKLHQSLFPRLLSTSYYTLEKKRTHGTCWNIMDPENHARLVEEKSLPGLVQDRFHVGLVPGFCTQRLGLASLPYPRRGGWVD